MTPRLAALLPKEKHVELAGDRLMGNLGFRIVKFSQARATRQTPGIPDRRYVHRVRRLAVWWEAKRETDGAYGQTPAQREFELDCRATGEHYVLGALDELEDWCIQHGFMRRDGLRLIVLK